MFSAKIAAGEPDFISTANADSIHLVYVHNDRSVLIENTPSKSSDDFRKLLL